ncbi:MAG: hypothetical protein LHV68_06210 [Elusimicrobia bacterium]|nr:hypothetical protein [Candidatus Liberimonas magnetica]
MLKIILFFAFLIFPQVLLAGVSNPNISVVGQFNSKYTNDQTSENQNMPTLNLGETELVFDANLNPYAKGYFVFSVGNEGFGTEEAFISIFKGLPSGLALKGGKYRVGFGKLNTVHPHAYPFIETARVISNMLPGKEGFNDTGVQTSYLLPFSDKFASTLSVDVLNGASFHPDETKSASAYLCRWSNSFMINERHPFEIGASFTQGTNNVQWKSKTDISGIDFKAKINFENQNSLVFQGEYILNNADIVIDTTTGTTSNLKRNGFYLFTDYKFAQRYNAGFIYDQYQNPDNKELTDKAVKGFIGYSLMEETTIFRLSFERFYPDGPAAGGLDAVDTYMFQVLFSLGPHKPHQF